MLTKSEKPEFKQETQRRTSRLAIVSSICLIIALLLILLFTWTGVVIFNVIASVLFPVSFILGVTACVLITKTNELKGYFYTIAPISIGFVVTGVLFLMVFNVVSRRHYEKSHTSLYNLKLLSKAIGKYAENNNGQLPKAQAWCDILLNADFNLSRDNFAHPLIEGRVIAFNKNLDGLKLDDIPPDTVLFFEADGDLNLAGTHELIEASNFSTHHMNVILVNGRIKTYWIDKKGFRAYDNIFMPAIWQP